VNPTLIFSSFNSLIVTGRCGNLGRSVCVSVDVFGDFFIECLPVFTMMRMFPICRPGNQVVTKHFDVHLSIEASEICNAGRISRISAPPIHSLTLPKAKFETLQKEKGEPNEKA
jgi:hypothetical protein